MGRKELWDASYWQNGTIDEFGKIKTDAAAKGCYTIRPIQILANETYLIGTAMQANSALFKMHEYDEAMNYLESSLITQAPVSKKANEKAAYLIVSLLKNKSEYDFSLGSFYVISEALDTPKGPVEEALENIAYASLGKDVRQSIYNGIDTINKESKADMESKQEVIDTYTGKQDALDEKYDRLLDEMSKANPSLAEVVDARQDEGGNVFTNLRERLNFSDGRMEDNKNALYQELNTIRDDSNAKISANQAAISTNQTNISATNNSLTTLRNDVNSYKTATNNRLSSLESDTGWIGVILNSFAFAPYSGTVGLQYRAIGKIINIRGTLTTRSPLSLADGNEAALTMMPLPGGACPPGNIVTVQQGSGKAVFITNVKTDGTITVSRYREGNSYLSTLPDNVWLPINIMYIAK